MKINWLSDFIVETFNVNFHLRNGLTTEDCYQIGKELNSAQVYSRAIEWLTESMKRFDEYYDQHQVRAVDILEELALSFIGNNQVQEAEKVIEKVSRMNSNSHVVKGFKEKEKNIDSKDKHLRRNNLEGQKLCHSIHFLSANMFTCPI